MRAHHQPREGDHCRPHRADDQAEPLLAAQPLADGRQQDGQHRAGRAARVPRRERAELVRRDALGDQLGLQTPAELPPRLEIALVPCGKEQAHPRPPPGDLDDVDDDHHADGDERQHEDETQDRLRLAALGAEQQQKTRQRRGEYRHQRRHPQRHRRHIVPCLMDRQHDPAGHQHSSRRDEQHVPAFAQPLAVKKQQNARARHREEGRKLAERPNGDFEFQENDVVAIASERRNAIDFFRKIGIVKNRVGNAILAGGGKVSYYLAKSLLASGIRVTIIEVDRERCDILSELLPHATVICGDATDQNLLLQEGLEHAQGFAALTGLDEENILLSLYANDVSNAKTVTKINRINFHSVINELNLGSIIYPRIITSDYILKYARSTYNSKDSNVETLYKLANGKAEALEFIIKADSAVAGIPLADLHFRKNTLICCIYRNGKVIIPSGQDIMMAGDSVLVVLSGYRISDIKEILED